MMTPKDGLGYELRVGQCVVWIGGKTQYSGVVKYYVEKVNEKRSAVYLVETRNGKKTTKTRIAPNENLVIIDKILDNKL